MTKGEVLIAMSTSAPMFVEAAGEMIKVRAVSIQTTERTMYRDGEMIMRKQEAVECVDYNGNPDSVYIVNYEKLRSFDQETIGKIKE